MCRVRVEYYTTRTRYPVYPLPVYFAGSRELSRSPHDAHTYECDREKRQRRLSFAHLLRTRAGTRRLAVSYNYYALRNDVPAPALFLRTGSLRTSVPIRTRCLGMADQGELLRVIIRGAVEACTLTLKYYRGRRGTQLGAAAAIPRVTSGVVKS